MLQHVCLLLPVLVSFGVALASCLPWGAPLVVQYAMPLLTMAVIFNWTMKRRELLPSPAIFLIGLFMDLATAGPLGYWALNFLIAMAVASYSPGRFAGQQPAAMVMFAAAVATVTVFGWLLASLLAMRASPVGSFLLGGLLAVAAYPAVGYLLAPFDRAVGVALDAIGRGRDNPA